MSVGVTAANSDVASSKDIIAGTSEYHDLLIIDEKIAYPAITKLPRIQKDVRHNCPFH